MNTLKKTLVLAAVLCPFLAIGQAKFTVQCQVEEGLKGKAALHRYTLERGISDDTLSFRDSKFAFSGNMYTTEPEIGQVVINDRTASPMNAIFYLEPGTINIQFMGSQKRQIVSGTPLNRDLQEYNDMIYGYLDSLYTAGGNTKRYGVFSTEVQDRSVAIMEKFAKKHLSSLVSLDGIWNMATYTKAISKPNQAKLSDIFQHLSPVLKGSEKGKEFVSKIKGLGVTGVGQMAPLFSMADTLGRVTSLSEFRGKYVLLDFWATWCGPCLAEMPNVAKIYRNYKNKNFTIVGVSMDRPDSKKKWLSLIKENNYNWTQLCDFKWWNCEAALLYNVGSAPANFLIDPNGKIIAKDLIGEKLESKLKEIFD
ncbi:redoxin domain-containing protein [Pedobacter sp. R-06]|uniref:redoxin domain-containing protein n=1 Tax=Pedobacter sp. R-06 TaxID=3404051 RepID=UPI003CE9B770